MKCFVRLSVLLKQGNKANNLLISCVTIPGFSNIYPAGSLSASNTFFNSLFLKALISVEIRLKLFYAYISIIIMFRVTTVKSDTVVIF